MSDPLADPRATDLLAAIPDEVGALAANFRSAGSESQATSAGLSAARHDGTWTGRAADAFRRAIGRLPGELDRVRAGFDGVAAALYVYEPELARIQYEFVQVAGALDDAISRLGPAQAAAQAAATELRTAAHTRGVTPRALIDAELAVARAEGSVGDYNAEIGRLRHRAFALLDEFASLRETCRTAIAEAQRGAVIRPALGHGTTVIDLGGPISAAGAGASGGVAVTGALGDVSPGVARQRIATMIRNADSLLGTPYVSGGGHAGWSTAGGLDCSGFVSAVLRSGGYLSAPQTTEGFAAQAGIAAGHGRFVTIYDRTGCGPDEHVIIDLNGRFYEAGGGSASGGAPFVHEFAPSHEYLASFNTVLHPAGL
jgi:cell wall-associated NlpC family hydrolase